MYDNPNRIKYQITFDAGNNGNGAWEFRGPKGKAGRLIDYGVEAVTEAFTTDASVAIGTAADPDAYGEELALGALGQHACLSVLTQYDPGKDKAAHDALIVQPVIPADADFRLTVVDDAASGIGNFFVIVDWDN